MNIWDWLRTWRRSEEPATADEIREQLADLRGQLAVTVAQRDLCAADAVNDAASAQRWGHLDDSVQIINRRMDMLAAALRAAEDREAADAMRAAEERLTADLTAFYATDAEVHSFADAAIANLPNDEELNLALKLEKKLGADAARLRAEGLDDVILRRPFSPLAAIVDALKLRIERVERVRFHPGSPIRLDRRRDDAVAQAIERVVGIKETAS
jgi:hypothetical protein